MIQQRVIVGKILRRGDKGQEIPVPEGVQDEECLCTLHVNLSGRKLVVSARAMMSDQSVLVDEKGKVHILFYAVHQFGQARPQYVRLEKFPDDLWHYSSGHAHERNGAIAVTGEEKTSGVVIFGADFLDDLVKNFCHEREGVPSGG